ncbi:hypothetical protein ABH920_001686 [Catenulispora sp. EB89]|uniref:TRAFAC clade GTPase domain-containing protein n=1 Tax=Catenulispora sp. EB89 TaxID=3156257 RepID=UPI0035182D25
MEELFFFAVIVAGIALYCLALIFFAVVVGPFVVLGTAAVFVGAAVVGYVRILIRTMSNPDPAQRDPRGFPPEREPEQAYRQYFFGPAMFDLRRILRRGQADGITLFQDSGAAITGRFITSPGFSPLIARPVGLALWVGLVVGGFGAAVLLAVVALLHVLTIGIAQLVSRAAIGVLRGADTAASAAKGIRGMTCPHCYRKIDYPSYSCEAPDCSRRHRDVRPGRYGVLRRRCACGARLPTLLLLGSHQLPAFCPEPECGRAMSEETGRRREQIVPLFGARAAGKTQLMAAIMMRLMREAERDRIPARLADDETSRAYRVLTEILQEAGHVTGTGPELPRARSIYLGSGRSERLIHLFDAAGERFTTVDRTDELEYFRAARSLLFVLDPLSVPAFRETLRPQARDTLDWSLASKEPPGLVFDQAVQTLIQMGAPAKRTRLAVAVSKFDLFDGLGTAPPRTSDSAACERWLTEELGLGNLVRSMRHEFGEVRFSFTAAVLTADGEVDPTIANLSSWLLGGERLPRQLRKLTTARPRAEPSAP